MGDAEDVRKIIAKYPELKPIMEMETSKADREIKDVVELVTTIKFFREKMEEIEVKPRKTRADEKTINECEKVLGLHYLVLKMIEDNDAEGSGRKKGDVEMEPVEIAAAPKKKATGKPAQGRWRAFMCLQGR